MMKKHIILWAAVLAALIIFAVILGIMAFSPRSDKETEEEISVPTATPEVVVLPTATPAASPEPIPVPAPAPTEETTVATTPIPSKKPVSKVKNSYAFTLNISGRKINIAYGADEATLGKTPGWMETSAAPGMDGMCVVYGHRNRTHLRVLEKVKAGDPIAVTMPDGAAFTYIVKEKLIYEDTADLRLPLTDGKSIALVTCYPFRYSGSAPGKCLVLGRLAD